MKLAPQGVHAPVPRGDVLRLFAVLGGEHSGWPRREGDDVIGHHWLSDSNGKEARSTPAARPHFSAAPAVSRNVGPYRRNKRLAVPIQDQNRASGLADYGGVTSIRTGFRGGLVRQLQRLTAIKLRPADIAVGVNDLQRCLWKAPLRGADRGVAGEGEGEGRICELHGVSPVSTTPS